MATHTITITDARDERGYGPLGHGTWLVTCSCGWRAYSNTGGRNRAEFVVADDHLRLHRNTRQPS